MIQPAYVIIYVDNQTIGKNVWFDNVHVEHYTSKLLEEDHYYPIGLTVGIDQAAQSNLPAQPYKLTGKELEPAFGLNAYDFGARMQDMQLGRWWSVGPLADKYFGISPYAYTGNNPVKFVDLDGRDYGLYFTNVATIKMTVYASAASAASASQSADRLNSQSGRFEWVVGSGASEITFPVNFEVTVIAATDNTKSADYLKAMDNSGEANSYNLVDDEAFNLRYGEKNNGMTIEGNNISVKLTHEKLETGAHEIGHGMGMVHNSKGKGLLTFARKDRKNTNLQEDDVADAIKYPLKDKTNSEYQDGIKIKAGKGHVVNGTECYDMNTPALSNKELSKGRLREIKKNNNYI